MILWLLFEITLIFKDMTHNLKGIFTFQNFHTYFKMINKKNVIYSDNYKHFL
jgi:hypothetical protein